VHECLKALRVGPYKDYGKLTVREALRRYWPWLAGGLLLLALLVAFAAYVSRLNRRLHKAVAEQSRELTEREQAEEALRDSEERFRAIGASAHDAIIMMDNNGEVSYWNQSAERILGYGEEEVLGRVLHDFLAPERFRAAHDAAFPIFRTTGEGGAIGRTLELAALHRTGAEIPVELSLSSMRLRGEWHALGIIRDITERKQAEARLRRAKEETEVANAGLEQAIARAQQLALDAEAANIAKSEFLANMSHEIRTPMNGVIGMTGLLLDTGLTSEQRDYAERVTQSAESLLTVINDILDFSKMEAGKLALEVLDFDLRTTLEDMGDVLALRPQAKGLEYVCLVDPDVPSLLRGDPGRLRQVLTNLTGNAVKFTSKGEVRVHVALEKEGDATATIRFSVIDTGIGIPADRLDALFDAFTQVDASTTRKYGGTGLGLSISKQLAELMGGQIGVESEEGKGSTLWFTAVFQKQSGGASAVVESPGDLRGKRILVVDDNETNRLLLERQLLSWGCRHEEAVEGGTALEKLRAAAAENDPFDVAILDMMMPGMDGEALGSAFKGEGSIRDVALVMMTSIGPVLGQRTPRKEERAAPLVTKHTLSEAAKRSIRILLAEDNTTNRIVALKLLEKLGYRADAVANGLEALKALETIPYDLVLMDVQMPEMDGFEATRKVRGPQSSVLNPEIPIVAMTAHAMKDDREECLEAGMNDYVSKPVNPQELADALERQLRDVARRSETAGPPQDEEAQPQARDQAGTRRDTPAFDESILLERLDGDRDFVRSVLEVFVDDAPKQLELLKEALEAGDADAVRRQGHRLKGAAGNVGAPALEELSLEAENAGRAGDLETAALVARTMEHALEELMAALAGKGVR